MPSAAVTITRSADAVPLAEVSALLLRAADPDGELPLSEGKRLDLDHGGRNGFLALVARGGDGTLVGYAQATLGQEGWGLETVTDPAHAGGSLRRELVRTALGVLRGDGHRVHYWVSRPPPGSDDELAELGLTPDRDQLQMRVILPLAAEVTRGPAVAVRPFRPGDDDSAWLAVNNRAFADHPEQGGWDLRALQDREEQPWFDPAGFLVHEMGGRLAASCWTKVHPRTTPPMGEIYVISVDPDFHGRGLGRALTVAGLDWLAGQGYTTGMLFTGAANAAAVGLYRSLGFTVHRLDRVYTLDPDRAGPDGGGSAQEVPTPTARPMP